MVQAEFCWFLDQFTAKPCWLTRYEPVHSPGNSLNPQFSTRYLGAKLFVYDSAANTYG